MSSGATDLYDDLSRLLKARDARIAELEGELQTQFEREEQMTNLVALISVALEELDPLRIGREPATLQLRAFLADWGQGS